MSAVAQAPTSSRASSLAAIQRQIARGDLAGADQILWSRLSAKPNDEQALILLGVVRTGQQRYLEAESLFRRVLQINPESVQAYCDLANSLIAQEKLDEAIAAYQQAQTLAPADIHLKVELAQLEVGRGRFNEALATLDAIPFDKFPRTALPLKAASLLGIRRVPEAAALIKQVSGFPSLAMELADVFLAANQPEEALRALDFAQPVSSRTKGASHLAIKQTSRFYYIRGRALQAKGEHAAALTSFQRALAIDVGSVEPLLAMSEVYAAQNKHSESLAMLERARRVSHDSVPVLRRLVVEAMNAGQRQVALRVLPVLLQKSQNAPDDLYLVAAVMLQDRRYVEAGQLLEKYAEQRPQDAKGLMGLGMAYVNQRRYAEARKALERSLALDPNLAESEYELSVVADKEGNRAEAIGHLQRAVQQDPAHGRALFDLGNIYLEAGELDKALDSLQRSAVADPTNSRTEYDLGLVLAKLGHPDQAKEHLDRFRKMEETHEAEAGRLGNKPERQ